jgi:hypothetical protein
MITGDTEHGKFVIGTPTKCGTTTLEALAHRHARNNPGEADAFRVMDWDSPRRQHRMCLPPAVSTEGVSDEMAATIVKDGHLDEEDIGSAWPEPDAGNEWTSAARYLLVRNPFTRYMSMYTYLSAPANYSQWGARLIQGTQWGGHDPEKMYDTPKMTFNQFLVFIAAQREINNEPKWGARRGPLNDGRAYRSPWVWTDSLTDSYEYLQMQRCPDEDCCPPDGGPCTDYTDVHAIRLIRLESVWEDLADVSAEYGLGEEGLLLGGLHSNRSTGRGEKGAKPGSDEFWGGIKCTRKVFKDRKFRGLQMTRCSADTCGPCRIGVADEAIELGYTG